MGRDALARPSLAELMPRTPAPAAGPSGRGGSKARNATNASNATEQVPFRLPLELADRIRNAVVEDRETLAAFAAAAFERELARREKLRGGPYPKRQADPRPGRRM